MVSNTQRSVTQTRCLVWSQFNSTYSLWEVIDWSQHRTRALQCSKSAKPYRTRRTGFRYCKEYLWISMLYTTNLSPDRPSCRRSQGLYESAAVYPKVLVVQSLAPRAAHVNFVMMASQRFWASFIKQVLLMIWWDFIRKMLIMRRIQHGIYLRLRLFTILIGYRMFIRSFFFTKETPSFPRASIIPNSAAPIDQPAHYRLQGHRATHSFINSQKPQQSEDGKSLRKFSCQRTRISYLFASFHQLCDSSPRQ